MTRTGAGAINIDGGRIESGTEHFRGKVGAKVTESDWKNHSGFAKPFTATDNPLGRWPANFILDEVAGKRLDEQSGIQKGGFVRNRTDGARPFENNGKDTGYEQVASIDEPDAGASRFFYRVQEQIDENDPIYYCSKASKDERDAGLKKHCQHPTLKPIDLARYLSTLLLPPTMYAPRRLFVPFAGVASECIGAFQAGWEEIVGIEMEEEYIPLARARAEYWQGKGFQPKLV